jgi:hypothetical protein
MSQWVALDRAARVLYYALLAGTLAGCRTGVAPIAPAQMPPLELTVVASWVDSLLPGGARRYGVRWTVETQKGQLRGRAAARVVPPDSLRFDYRAPFGRSGAAVVIGDSLRWAKPEERNPVPPAPLFWAALGIPLRVPPGAVVTGREITGERAWRYAAGEDTLTYVVTTGSGLRLRAMFRRNGDVVGTVVTVFDSASGLPTESTVLFPRSGALFLMTVQEVEDLASVEPDIWEVPEP